MYYIRKSGRAEPFCQRKMAPALAFFCSINFMRSRIKRLGFSLLPIATKTVHKVLFCTLFANKQHTNDTKYTRITS